MNTADICPKCREPITAADVFCNNCGHRLKADENIKRTKPPTSSGSSRDRLINIILLVLFFALIFGIKAWLDGQGLRAPWNKPEVVPTRHR